MREREECTKIVAVKTEGVGNVFTPNEPPYKCNTYNNNPLKLTCSTSQHQQLQQQDETETSTDLSDLQLNNSIINVIEQHMPIELFMDTPPLTGDCSSTHSTNSMCSTGGISSADAELQQNNQQSTTTTTTANAAVLALDTSTTAQTLTTDVNDDYPANVDGDGERPLVFVIITDYDMQQ